MKTWGGGGNLPHPSPFKCTKYPGPNRVKYKFKSTWILIWHVPFDLECLILHNIFLVFFLGGGVYIMYLSLGIKIYQCQTNHNKKEYKINLKRLMQYNVFLKLFLVKLKAWQWVTLPLSGVENFQSGNLVTEREGESCPQTLHSTCSTSHSYAGCPTVPRSSKRAASAPPQISPACVHAHCSLEKPVDWPASPRQGSSWSCPDWLT